ncbi:MAG: L-threonylcarbamoyladenylate synthase [Clostridium sp.]|nr:L-threonylcarbamoyladenylate synthase [Clostridium sp.]MCM1171717.1 L-threonylcarbamoyladenylate synthase [Clostridium sp.]MCM1207395.1 L-threonylcarbamoyladenylate synthase [Ruminococcus sp.]
MDETKNTIIMNCGEKGAISKAAVILRKGGLVAFPTETVYGLGADALNPEASGKIYTAKGRPSDNPLIVHIADTYAVYKLASHVPKKAVMLMEAFWPGPLTIILPKKDIVPRETTGGLDTVAIRMPSHPAALDMIRQSQLYIAAPSANISGRPSPTTAGHVISDMEGRIDMILDGGAVGIGIESTIVDMTGDAPIILRPGFITKAMLENIVGAVAVDKALTENSLDIKPKAPGMKYTHYAPKGELTIVELDDAAGTDDSSTNEHPQRSLASASSYITRLSVAKRINDLISEKKRQGFKTAVIASAENVHLYNCENILVAGERTNGETIAAKLYGILRECDDIGADYIYSEAFHHGKLGDAIMNRLLKAAGQRVIKI